MQRLVFTGDMLSYPSTPTSQNSLEDGKYNLLFQDASFYFKENYVCASLETPIAEGLPLSDSYTNFNTPKAFLVALKNAGVSLLTTANNHALDRGILGLQKTCEALDELQLAHTGTYRSLQDSEQILVHDVDGVNVAFLSFTYGTNSRSNKCYLDESQLWMVDLLRQQDKLVLKKRSLLQRLLLIIKNGSLKKKVKPAKVYRIVHDQVPDDEATDMCNLRYLNRLSQKVRKAKSMADIVVVCLHSGGQFNFHLGVGPYTNFIVEYLAKLGVDLIVGNHTHCVLPARWLSDSTFCAYSLGNFTFTPGEGYYIEGEYADYSILLNVDVNPAKKKLSSISFSIMKCVKAADGSIRTLNVNDLYGSLSAEEQALLLQESAVVWKQFCGGKDFRLQKEYQF